MQPSLSDIYHRIGHFLAQMDKPTDEAFSLPGFCYTSQAWFDLEIENLFLKEWLFVAREEEIPNVGDYLRVDIVSEPLLLVRAEGGEIHAFLATCTHRQAELVAGKGNCHHFSCPYHAWTFDLDGNLVGAPGMSEVKNFDRSQHSLTSVKIESWEGFLFINFDPNSESLVTKLGDLTQRVSSYRLKEMRTTQKLKFDYAGNWKLFLENSREGYHAGTVHRSVYDEFYPGLRRPNWTVNQTIECKPGVYEVLSGNLVDGMWHLVDNESELPILEGLSPDDQQCTHFILIYPCFMLALSPSNAGLHQLFPLAPDRTVDYTWSFFPSEIVDNPLYMDKIEAHHKLPATVIQQDADICEIVQKGFSRFVRPGRYASSESIVHEIGKYVIDRVLGKLWRNTVSVSLTNPIPASVGEEHLLTEISS